MPCFSRCKRKLLTSLITSSLLAACGAGSDNPPPSAPYVSPVERNSVLQVPAPTYTDAWKLSAFNRLNEVRQQAGIGLLTQNATIDIAAQNHSSYQVNHSMIEHTEPESGSDGTGGDSSARINYVVNPAYPVRLDYNSSTEVIAPVQNRSTAQSGSNLIDSLLGTPYHRSALLTPEWADVGIGFDGRSAYANITINIARTAANTQGAPQTPYIIWPPDGSTDVPTAMVGESPNPIPENNGAMPGYAASIQTNPLLDTALGNVSVFEIRDPAGAVVPTKLLSTRTDPNLTPLGAGAFIAALPRAPLAKNTKYQVIFKADLQKGIILREDKPMEKTWSFTTGDKLYY
jgi:uncharacterized protein YkwD